MNKCFSFFLFAFGLPPDPWSGHFLIILPSFVLAEENAVFYLFMPPYQKLHLWILNIDFKYFLWVYLIIGVDFLIYSSDSARGQFSSVQSLSHVQLFATHESQHTRLPCPSSTPGVHPNSCASSQWCHPAISSSVVPFSSCPQYLPAPGSFPMSQHFTWCGQSIGVSASASVLPMNTQDWSPLGLTGWISLQSKGLSKVFSNTTVRKMVTITLYTRQQKRHWCIEQSFGLCGRGRGWDDLG